MSDDKFSIPPGPALNNPSGNTRKRKKPPYVLPSPLEEDDVGQATTGANGHIDEAGLEAALAAADAALESGTEQEPVPDPPVPNFKELQPQTYPLPDDRPCFRLYPGAFTVGERLFPPGVYFHTMAGKGEESYPVDTWLCAPLSVSATTANKEDGEYGRLLEFRSSNHVEKKWSMPMALLAGDGVEVLERLLSEGLAVNYPRRKKIPDYISSERPKTFLHCATRTGWHSADTFVLPDCVIGTTDIWFQSHTRVAAYAKAGTFKDWKTLIAERALGNPFLLFGLAFSLCGPLLWSLNFPGSGIHFYGDSTTGKTSLLEGGASCWGNGEHYKRTWRATANGLEGVCVQHTDTLLVLDEISEIGVRDLDQVAYFLVNGQGKSRATRHGEAKPEMRWRVALLSSGEQSIAGKLYGGGISIKAGQQMRILDIPISGTYGLFDDLHKFANGAAFADAIRAAASSHYGHAGPAFIEAIIRRGKIDLASEHATYVSELATGDSQQDRAAGRIFAVAALAGELAIEAGIFPWDKGTALHAACDIFDLWRQARQIGNCGGEQAEILSKVLDFVNAHGTARFSNISPSLSDSEPIVRDRAGWWEADEQDDNRVYLFTPGALKEATKGYELNRALKALDDAGAFAKKGSNAKGISTRTPDGRTPRLYWIKPEKLEVNG